MPAKKPRCTLRKLETGETENGRTGRHVLWQEPDQQWGAAPQNGSDIGGWCLDGGVALCTPELGPDTCSRPAVTELPTASPAVQCALRLHSQLHSVHPAQRHAVGLASKHLAGSASNGTFSLTLCALCASSLHKFSQCTLLICAAVH